MSPLFLDRSIGRIQEELERGDLVETDLATACIEQYERLEAQVRAWVCFDAEQLEARSRALRRSELVRDWLYAIPVGVKDVFNTARFPTQMGSPLWRGFTPGNDARVVHQIQEYGAVLAGKTVTAEFAVHALNETINPHDPDRTPGTSSSGSAAAVATGMVPFALATQTAGSIVRPASFCGVYGCRPSFGLIPRTGILKTTDSLDSVGFFVSRGRDLVRCFEAVRVRGPNYPLSFSALTDPARQRPRQAGRWRVGAFRTHTWESAEESARRALEDFVAQLNRQPGIEVDWVELPESFSRAHDAHHTIYAKTLAYYFQGEYEQSQLISAVMNRLIESGLRIELDEYDSALAEQMRLASHMDSILHQFDVGLSLATAGIAPPRFVEETPDPALMWTMFHLPIVAVPAFADELGRPFGVQMFARKYSDYLLLTFVQELISRRLIPAGANPLASMVG